MDILVGNEVRIKKGAYAGRTGIVREVKREHSYGLEAPSQLWFTVEERTTFIRLEFLEDEIEKPYP